MDAEWIKSPTARRVLVHWADDRPAWLWSADGRSLLWRNGAAGLFHAKLKKSGLKRAPEPVPIKGQVARLLRLGSLGRSSLSRIQFLAGSKPVSATCTVTPLELAGGEMALLVVGVDPIDAEVLEASAGQAFDTLSTALFPPGAEYLLVEGGAVRDGTPRARERFAASIDSLGIPDLSGTDSGETELAGEKVRLTRFRASPQDAVLLLIEAFEPEGAQSRIDSIRAEEGLATLHERAPADLELPQDDTAEPLLPIGLPPLEEAPSQDAAESGGGTAAEDLWVEPFEPPAVGPGRSLSSLFDRLAGHEELYAPLPEPEEISAEPQATPKAPEPAVAVPTTETEAERPSEPAAAGPQGGEGPDMIAAVIEFADDNEEIEEAHEAAAPVTYRVIGRGFTPIASESAAAPAASAEAPPEPAAEIATDLPAPPPSPEIVERVSRYNFDELSRILTDRVGAEGPAAGGTVEIESPIAPGQVPLSRAPDRALVNVAAETFILNRLPIGIMVFRDQQVLFANRALTDLIGYETIDALRNSGLAAIFPSEEAAAAGPVTHLVHKGGTLLPVVARLQSITWQGRPALMLSASLSQAGTGYEGVVKAFAEALAEQRGEGFVVADRAGVVTRVTAKACALLGGAEADIAGKPLAALIDAKDGAALRGFLDGPAKFAETARPCLLVGGLAPQTSLLLFAEGRAGIVSGYFGLLRRESVLAAEAIEPSMLARVSRGVRRPLNSIIGFSDLIRSAAFGTLENQRYLEYARDIKTAGQEIAALVDELDDIARLKEGSYAARPAELDLGGLLESCMVRVREQAGAARVLVRSAISERLPRIRADRASLRQAVLNLLASAIDQTPSGGTVVLSAQLEDDGSIAVNVRDSGGRNTDPAERFVVFRDGVGKDGEMLLPMRSSVGLALTRSLLAVNTCSLSVDPSTGVGTLFSLLVPADLVAR